MWRPPERIRHAPRPVCRRRRTRDDGYGRTLAGRVRLPLEVYGAVRTRLGRDFPVGCRFLADECMPSYYSDARGPFGRNLAAAAAIRAAVDRRGAGRLSAELGGALLRSR